MKLGDADLFFDDWGVGSDLVGDFPDFNFDFSGFDTFDFSGFDTFDEFGSMSNWTWEPIESDLPGSWISAGDYNDPSTWDIEIDPYAGSVAVENVASVNDLPVEIDPATQTVTIPGNAGSSGFDWGMLGKIIKDASGAYSAYLKGTSNGKQVLRRQNLTPQQAALLQRNAQAQAQSGFSLTPTNMLLLGGAALAAFLLLGRK